MIPIPATLSSAAERIEQRNALRNLETFLTFDFLSGSRLGILDKHVYGTAVERLKCVRRDALSWGERLMSRLYRTYDLRRVCSSITKQMPIWIQALAHDDDKLIALERRLALLERVVAVYNHTISKSRPEWEVINFINPLKRVLRVQIHYPQMIDQEVMTTVTRDVSYDRLTSKEALEKLMMDAASLPVTVRFMADKVRDNSAKSLYSLNVVPQHIFKNVLQNPLEPIDPDAEAARSNMQVVDFTFSLVDWPSVASALHAQGQNDAMPRVYQQGVADGWQVGYNEAMTSITAAFHKAIAAK